MNFKSIIYKHIKTKFALWLLLTIICGIIFRFFVFPHSTEPSLWYITFSLTMMFLTMGFFESILIGVKKKKVKIFGGKKKPKIFEFGFFLFLFIATIYASEVIALTHLPDQTIEDRLELIRQNFWFIGLYGVSIAFGIYHYIFRVDDDNDIQIKRK